MIAGYFYFCHLGGILKHLHSGLDFSTQYQLYSPSRSSKVQNVSLQDLVAIAAYNDQPALFKSKSYLFNGRNKAFREK